ncbi:MAG: alpha/beta hydrolase [Flavobacteriales bacterium]|nr:alpha/beta hydrolase [Flavobacteriales bacterium]
MPFAEYKKARVYFTEKGTGKTVVLLHGFLENSTMWKFAIPELSKKYRVVSIDLPGHGKSACFGYVHTMEEMAEAVKSVISQLKIRKASIVGHSMGGYVSLAFGDLFPDHTRSICLFFSTTKADNAQKKKSRNGAIELVKKNHKSFVRIAFPLLFRSKYRTVKRDEIKLAKEEALKTPKQGIIAALEGMKRRPSREVLLKFAPFPIHFISGQRDPVIDIKTIGNQLKGADKSTAIILKGPGHMGHIESPEECLKELKAFCAMG